LGTSSPFNIKVKSLRLGDFTEADVQALYAQHTADTGQEFTDEALTRAWENTAGQPWLVNALASEVVEELKIPVTESIAAEHIDTAKERLILARATHLDSLLARLYEPRVRRILEPMIAGDTLPPDPTYDDDLSYVRDLGLIAKDKLLRIANPIYQEVIVRVLGSVTEDQITAEPRSFVAARRATGLRPSRTRVRRFLAGKRRDPHQPQGVPRVRPAPGLHGVPPAAGQWRGVRRSLRAERRAQYQPGVRHRPRSRRPARPLALYRR